MKYWEKIQASNTNFSNQWSKFKVKQLQLHFQWYQRKPWNVFVTRIMRHDLCVTVRAPVQAVVQASFQKLFFGPPGIKKVFKKNPLRY